MRRPKQGRVEDAIRQLEKVTGLKAHATYEFGYLWRVTMRTSTGFSAFVVTIHSCDHGQNWTVGGCEHIAFSALQKLNLHEGA